MWRNKTRLSDRYVMLLMINPPIVMSLTIVDLFQPSGAQIPYPIHFCWNFVSLVERILATQTRADSGASSYYSSTGLQASRAGTHGNCHELGGDGMNGNI